MSSEARESGAFEARDWYLASTLVERAELSRPLRLPTSSTRSARRDAIDVGARKTRSPTLQCSIGDCIPTDSRATHFCASSESRRAPSESLPRRRGRGRSRKLRVGRARSRSARPMALDRAARRRSAAPSVRHRARARRRRGADPHSHARIALSASLPRDRLRTIAARTRVLEVNVARLRGEITGATSSMPTSSSDWPSPSTPPVSTRVVSRACAADRRSPGRMGHVQAELIARLRADWDAVRAAFFANESPRPARRHLGAARRCIAAAAPS